MSPTVKLVVSVILHMKCSFLCVLRRNARAVVVTLARQEQPNWLTD
jgi:hypothetical protein